MEPNYIQLPPMPSNMPIELLEIIWGFARMEGTEKEKFLEFIRNVLKMNSEDGRSERLIKMMEESALEPSPYVEEFNSLMRDLIGTWLHRHVRWRRLFSNITVLMKNP